MTFYPNGTFLHEENNIIYQIYSNEYYEQTFCSIIESRIVDRTIYSNFSIDREAIEQSCKNLVENATIRIIAIDKSLQTPSVIGQIFAEDFKSFIVSQNMFTGNLQLDLLKQVNRKLLLPLSNIKYEFGEILIGSGYGVKKEYQNQKIGNNLSLLFLSVCLDSPYKVFCGLFYSQKASQIMVKNGGFIMNQLRIEDCKEIDKNISNYMKNNIEIVAYIDTNKDSQNFQKLKTLHQQQITSFQIK